MIHYQLLENSCSIMDLGNHRIKMKKKKKQKETEFSYVIAHSDKDGILCPYMMHNSEVFAGTIEDAKRDLEYAKREDYEEEWRIFVLSELDTSQETL